MTYLLMAGFAALIALMEWDRRHSVKAAFDTFVVEFMSAFEMMIICQIICLVV